jgi:hypothetical protein
MPNVGIEAKFFPLLAKTVGQVYILPDSVNWFIYNNLETRSTAICYIAVGCLYSIWKFGIPVIEIIILGNPKASTVCP